MRAAIGIDLGGTNIKAALIDRETGCVVSMQSRPTRDGEFENDVPRFALTVREVVRDWRQKQGRGNSLLVCRLQVLRIQMGLAFAGCQVG